MGFLGYKVLGWKPQMELNNAWNPQLVVEQY